MRQVRHSLFGLALALLATALAPRADADKPLLLADTKTIFERVLSKPGQILHNAPHSIQGDALWPLQPLYVFERRDGWLRVGRGTKDSEGWIEEAGAVPWVHNIVAAFTARGTSRERQLIFDGEEDMQRLLDHEAFFDLIARYRETAVAGSPEDGSGVLTIEKEEYVDISVEESFYLMPITAFKERRIGPRRKPTLYLEVAAVPLNQVTTAVDDPDLRSGIVFVIDTTSSMAPFIKETLAVVKDSVNDLRAKGRDQSASFGLIGFRDNPEGRPGTEYRVKDYLPLRAEDPPEAIVQALSQMKAMGEGSTWGFEEDSLAGLAYALENTSWQQGDVDFAGRFVVLITDAPPKPPGDENAETARSPQDVFSRASEDKVGLATVHIISRSGRGYNEVAEEAYRALSRFKNLPEEMYFPVDATDPGTFRANMKAVMAEMVTGITGESDLIEVEPNEEIDLSNVGKAMRLAYLGRKTGQDVPPILQGWTLDRSFEELNEFAIEPRVLISRNQLLGMTEIMNGMVEEMGRSARAGTENLFFENVRDVVVGIGADGQRLVNEGADNLGGMIAEFLEYMPYYSKRRIMQVNEREWINDPGLRANVALELEGKLELYESLFQSEELWTELFEGQGEGERVYAMPLEALP